MELLECLCMSECVGSVNCFYNCSPSKTYLFSLIFLRIFFLFFFICTYTVWYKTHVYVCSGTLLYTNSKGCPRRIFLWGEFCFLSQTVGCLLAYNIQLVWGSSFSVLLSWQFLSYSFFSLSMSMAVYYSFISSSSQSW